MVDDQVVGGSVPLLDDPRVIWCLDTIGGATGRRALELGSFEGAHTKTLIDQGAIHVTGIEGLRAAWIRSLIVKEIFEMRTATLLYGDFCAYVADDQVRRTTSYWRPVCSITSGIRRNSSTSWRV